MGSSPTERPPEAVVPPEYGPRLTDVAVRTELEKILASPLLREAGNLKRFLRYTVEHTLQGEGNELKEYRVGVEVFDRDSSFDPRLDPVVRMAARRLRKKLHEYYQGEGKNDPSILKSPKVAILLLSRQIAFPECRLECTPPDQEVIDGLS